MKKTLTFFSVLFILFLLIQRGSGVITKMILANSITSYEYAVITLVAITIPAFFQMATTLNFYQVLSHSQEGKDLFGFFCLASMVLFLVISFILLIFSPQFYEFLNIPAEYWELYTFAILFTLFSLTFLTDILGLFTGMKEYSIPGIVLAIPSLARLGLITILILVGYTSLETIILVFALVQFLPFLLFALVPKYRFVFGMMNKISLPSWKMMAFGASIFIVTSVPVMGQYLMRIAISHQLGVIWQGYFDVSLTVTSLLIFSISTMGFLSLPESTTGDTSRMTESGGMVDVARALLALTLFAGIVLSFYAHEIVVLLFSIEYAPAADYVPILVLAFFFLYLQIFLVSLNMASATSRSHYLWPTIISLVALPFFFFLGEWSISFFEALRHDNGFIGAYLAYTLVTSFLTIALVLASHDRTPCRFLLSKVERLIIPSVVAMGVLILAGPVPTVGIILAAVLFAVLVHLFGYVNLTFVLDMLHDPSS
jgi:O-antigen/teichoic acid export membrane protein